MSLIDPRLMETLADFTPATCTIQARTSSYISTGDLLETYANVTGLVDIPCQVSVQGGFMKGGKEQRKESGDYTTFERLITLDGYYPTITETMQALIGGVTYDIDAIDHDSQSTYTRLGVRVQR